MAQEKNISEKFFRNYNSLIKDNCFKFLNLTRQRLVPEFINSLNRLILKFGHDEIILDFSEVAKVYAYPTVPIVGIIEYFKKNKGINFIYQNTTEYLEYINIRSPIKATENNISLNSNALDKIWSFTNSKEINNLINSIISCIRRCVICESGVLDACEWGINEVMDNVLQHSDVSEGFIMTQVNKEKRLINVCIFDYGIGIYNTLKNSEHRPRNPIDAILYCVKEGVTRDKKIGQGNGLWGLHNIISLNNGHLAIISGKGGIYFKKNGKEVKTMQDLIVLNKKNQLTTVNFHLNLKKEISIKDAIGGYDIIDLYTESLENEKGEIIYKISDVITGTGTRESANYIRNELLNIYKKTKQPILIDFSKVGIISSNFSDELIGKLILEIGFYQFQSIFKLINMNKTIQSILDKSISQRFDKTGKG
jgi:hypothetical protein